MSTLSATEILNLLTKEDIIGILDDIGATYVADGKGVLKIDTVCHHTDERKHKRKLYYYHEPREDDEYTNSVGRRFHCYSGCGNMSVYDLLVKVNGWTIAQAINFVKELKGLSNPFQMEEGWIEPPQKSEDWDTLNRYKRYKQIRERNANLHNLLKPINEIELNSYTRNVFPYAWFQEYIKGDAMRKFEIMADLEKQQAIIPHRDKDGNLVGIRVRNFIKSEVEAGYKYMPAHKRSDNNHKERFFSYPMHYNLYGLYQNADTIRKRKKVLLIEAEKSVMQCESYYPDNNFSLALCSSNISNYQRSLILALDVDEVIIGLDRQYVINPETDEEIEEFQLYMKKVQKIAKKFVGVVNVSVIFCKDERIGYKDSPTDRGKIILEELLEERVPYKNVSKRKKKASENEV